MKKALLILLAAILTAPLSFAQSELRKYVKELSASEPLQGSVWGVLAVRMNGDTLVAYNSGQKMVPASNVKLVTAGAALRKLGPKYRYHTTLACTGEVRDSVLNGDLYILGGGDPTLGSKDDSAIALDSLFAQWKGLLTDSGIKAISGTIIGDGRCAGPFGESLNWGYDDIGFAYGAEPCGLNFYENAQDFTVKPGLAEGDTVSVEPFFPQTPWMLMSNRATTSAAGTGDGLYYFNTPFGPYAEMTGHYAIDRKQRIEECSNRFPAYTCAYYFYNYLVSNGIEVGDFFADISPDGFVRQDVSFIECDRMAADRDSLSVIGGTDSPELIKIIKEALYRSDNFYAETLLRTIGKDTEARMLANMGVNVKSGAQLVDGSGLSRTNYASPDFFVSFLSAMARTPEYKQYLRAIPRVGEGTLAARLPQAPAELRSRIRMKSGSMGGVRCFSGYVVPADGKTENTVVFSVMTNNVTASSQKVNPVIDRIITLIAQ